MTPSVNRLIAISTSAPLALLLTTPTAIATTRESTVPMTSATASHSQVEDGTLTQELIEKYSPYVSRAGTTYQFTPPEELRVAAPDEVALVEQTVSTTNVSIASGRIEVAGEDGATYYLDMQPNAFEDNGSHGGVEMTTGRPRNFGICSQRAPGFPPSRPRSLPGPG